MQLNIRSGPDAGRTITITGDQFTVGRDAGCDLTINDFKISRKHAYFKALPDGRAALHDLNSSNGTFVNGHRVQSALLSGGETVQFGDTQLMAQAGAPATAAAAPAPGAPPAPGPATPPTQPLPPTTAQPPAQQPRPQGPAPGPPRPAVQPVGGPQRSQSAIQRIMLQRSVRRATVIGVAAIVLVLAVAGLFAFGVLPLDEGDDGGGDGDDLRRVSEVVREVTPSTIFVQAFDDFGSGGTGTGWVWDAEEGIVVTNAHVISDDTFTQTLPDIRASVGTSTEEREVEVVYNATCVDLAVLRLEDTDDLRTLPRVEEQDELEQGDDVIAVGYPGTASEATQLVTNTGVLSVVQTSFDEVGPLDPDYQNVVQTDTAINPGNSGGPLVTRPEGDEPARLVGVNTLVRTTSPDSGRDIQGQNYAIGVDRVNEVVPDILDGEDVCAGTPLPEPGTGPADPNADPLIPVPTGP